MKKLKIFENYKNNEKENTESSIGESTLINKDFIHYGKKYTLDNKIWWPY